MKVERAVFLAAGLGTRLSPLTKKIPKPLIEINGRRIIDSLLDAVVKAGVGEIYLILGYKAEKFETVLKDYPMCKVINNPDYDKANNISSLFYAGEMVKNAYIIESDLWLRNSQLITPEQEYSNYLSVPLEQSSDWCFRLDENGIINSLTVGGTQCEQMVGISYWNEEDGKRLARRVAEVYKIENSRNLYWDQVPLEKYLSEFKIRTRRCSLEDVTEIDTVKELSAIDRSYVKYIKRGVE